MTTQNYTAWFTDYPSTHVKAGKTVEVVPRAELQRLRNVADDAYRSLRSGRPHEAEEYLRGIRNAGPPSTEEA